MTEEELEKKAIDWIGHNYPDAATPLKHALHKAYIDSAKSRNDEILSLNRKIKKLQCCENCYYTLRVTNQRVCVSCKNKSEWVFFNTKKKIPRR